MYCRAQLVELNDSLPALHDLDAAIFAISTDDLSGAQTIADRIGISFPILYNPDADVVKSFGVYDLRGDSLATPSTFIIDKQGVIRWKYIGSGKSDRPSVGAVLDQLRML